MITVIADKFKYFTSHLITPVIDMIIRITKSKLARRQFRNKVNQLKVGDLVYFNDGQWSAAIVLKVCPHHVDVYGQLSQKYYSVTAIHNDDFILEKEYNRRNIVQSLNP